MTDYERIENAIHYLQDNFRNQPSLEEVARHVFLSPFHFQRLFNRWAGVSPKKFIQFTTLEYAKSLLNKMPNLGVVSEDCGLSGTGRLHDLFVKIERMTPGQYKDGGRSLDIAYSHHLTSFGRVQIATTQTGICHLSFSQKDDDRVIKNKYPHANIVKSVNEMHLQALDSIEGLNDLKPLTLHLMASDFQLKVWSALLKIPFGQVVTYGRVAGTIGSSYLSRAVGTAIGNNPVAYLIPCHRVIKTNGDWGQYRWGEERKLCINAWEASKSIVG